MDNGKPTGGGAANTVEHLSVLIADDDVAFRAAIRRALEEDGSLLVSEAGDADSAIGAVSRLRPDICLVEVELPGDGLSASGRIAKESPEPLGLVLSRADDPEDLAT